MMRLLEGICSFSYYVYHFNTLFFFVLPIVLWLKYLNTPAPLKRKLSENNLIALILACWLISGIALIFLLTETIFIMYILIIVFLILHIVVLCFVNEFLYNNSTIFLIKLFIFIIVLILSLPCFFGIKNKYYNNTFGGKTTPKHLEYRLKKIGSLKKDLEERKGEISEVTKDFYREVDLHKGKILSICKKNESIDCSSGFESIASNQEIRSHLAIIQKETFYLAELEKRERVLTESCQELDFLIWSIKADKKMLETTKELSDDNLLKRVDEAIKEGEKYLVVSKQKIVEGGAQDEGIIWQEITSELEE